MSLLRDIQSAAVDTRLLLGDMIVCGKSDHFTVEIKTPSEWSLSAYSLKNLAKIDK